MKVQRHVKIYFHSFDSDANFRIMSDYTTHEVIHIHVFVSNCKSTFRTIFYYTSKAFDVVERHGFGP